MTIYDDMLVGELKKWPKIYQSLKAQWDEDYAGELFTDESRVIDAFLWSSGKEDDIFWSAIHSKRIDRAKEIHPHMFEEGQLIDNNSWTVGTTAEITEQVHGVSATVILEPTITFEEPLKEDIIEKKVKEGVLIEEEDEDFPHDSDLDLITNLIVNCGNVYNGHNQIEVKKGHLSFKELEVVIHELTNYYHDLDVEYICFPDGSGNLSLKGYWADGEHPNNHTDKLLLGWGID